MFLFMMCNKTIYINLYAYVLMCIGVYMFICICIDMCVYVSMYWIFTVLCIHFQSIMVEIKEL